MYSLVSFITDFVDSVYSFFIQFNTLLGAIIDFFDYDVLGYSIFDVWISVPVFIAFVGFGLVKTFVPVV